MSQKIRVEQTKISDVYTDQSDPSGFIDKTAVLSFNNGTREFTITGSHDIYINGIKYTKPTTTITITNTIGTHYIYYNSSGVLSFSNAFPGFYVPLVAIIYWDGTKGVLAEERHGINMPGSVHEYLHETVGARYISGLAGTFTNTTFSIGAGDFSDEDNDFTFLSPLTSCNVFYKNGTSNFTWDGPQTAPYKTVTGTIQYNNVNALANVSTSNFVAYWVFITNDINTPVMVLMGQREDTTIQNARTNNTYESLVLGQLPYQEAKLIYRIIYKNVAGTPTYQEAQDYRTVSNLPSGSYVATSHNILSDLQIAGNSITFGHITDQSQTLYGLKSFNDGIKVDTITELTTGAGINIEGLHYENDYINKGGSDNQGLTFDASDNATFTENLSVIGNLFVNGDKVAVDSRISTSDYILAMNFGETGSVVTSGHCGIETDRGSGNPYVNMFFEANDDYRIGEYYITVNYTGKTGSFNLNNEVKQATTNATGYVISDSGSALKLKVVKGTFTDTYVINNQTTTGSCTQSGVQVITDDTQAVATRQDTPTCGGVSYWNNTDLRFDTNSNFTFNSVTNSLDITGSITSSNFISDVAIGTSPYACTSTTLNSNLNADLLDGQHGSYYVDTVNIQSVGGRKTFTDYMSITHQGVVSSINTFLAITNTANAVSMPSTGTAISFYQYYYDPSTPASVMSGELIFLTEGNWTSTASTQNSFLRFSTALNGVVQEKARIDSLGNFRIGACANLYSTSVWSDFSNNAYWDSANWRYIKNGVAQLFQYNNLGDFSFQSAISGLLGNVITFTEYMKLTYDGILKIDDIAELTTDAGVTIEGNLLKDSTITSQKIFVTVPTAGEALKITGDSSDKTYQAFYTSITRKGYLGTNVGGTGIILHSDANGLMLQTAADDAHRAFLSSTGNFGIGTSNPSYKVSIVGTDSNATAGPNILAYTSDAYPLLQIFNFTHDNMSINFDSYYDGAGWKSSDAGSNFQIYKINDKLSLNYDSGISQGSTITFDPGIVLTNTGNVGIGTSSPAYKLQIIGSGGFGTGATISMDTSSSVAPRVTLTSNYDGGILNQLLVGAGQVFFTTYWRSYASNYYPGLGIQGRVWIYSPSDGSTNDNAEILNLPNNSATDRGCAKAYAWNTYSDSRVKINQTEINYGLNEIMKIIPKRYKHYSSTVLNGKIKMCDNYSNTIGLIAQEIYSIIPEAVIKPENDTTTLWGLNYDKFIPVIIKAIQELKKENDFLKEKIKH